MKIGTPGVHFWGCAFSLDTGTEAQREAEPARDIYGGGGARVSARLPGCGQHCKRLLPN